MGKRRSGPVLSILPFLFLSVLVSTCGEQPSSLGSIYSLQIKVDSLYGGDGRGKVVNSTPLPGDTTRIDCEFYPAPDKISSHCSTGFYDANGLGTVVLEATPEPGSELGGLGGDCGEDSGAFCTLNFTPQARERVGRFRFRLIEPYSVQISPSSATITELGEDGAQKLTATVLGRSGEVLFSGPLSWRSSDQEVVTVSPGSYPRRTATVAGTASGSAIITAETSNGVEGTAEVTVDLGAVIISDEMESADLWFDTVRVTQGGATSEAWHEATGGVEGGYRHIQHVLPGESGINVFHGFSGETYDPATQGAIESVSASWYRRKISPEGTQAVGERFALIQEDTIYFMAGSTFQNMGWELFETGDVTPAQFYPLPGPNFSSTGGVITFGFIRSNTRVGVGPLTIVHGTDKYRVVINRQ